MCVLMCKSTVLINNQRLFSTKNKEKWRQRQREKQVCLILEITSEVRKHFSIRKIKELLLFLCDNMHKQVQKSVIVN